MNSDAHTALMIAHDHIKDLYPGEIRAAFAAAINAAPDEHTRWRLNNLCNSLATVAAIYGDDNG